LTWAPAGVVVVAATAVAGVVLGVSVLGGAITSSASGGALAELELAAESCAVSGPVSGLSDGQAQVAEVVVATAMADSAENLQAARVALMSGLTESDLQNLGPLPNNQGSLGVFQQRTSQGWGTVAEELDPAQATAMFVHRLLAVPGWQTQPPWGAAQVVQRSAFASGANYRANWTRAGQVLNVVLANGNAPGGCGQGPTGGVAGPAARHGLPVGYVIPAGLPPGHSEAVAFALAQLGKSYGWGAAGPRAFDCSGLTMAAWATAGVHLLHYTVDQWHEGQQVALAEAVPGDLVLIPGSDPPGPGLPGHVGIYLGDGLVISAVDTQLGVAVQTWQAFVSGGLEGVVDPAPGR
jgi:cell wall-associated NlpC family hydrolase